MGPTLSASSRVAVRPQVPLGHPRVRTPRTDPEERGCAAPGVVAPRPPAAVRAHARHKVGVSRGPRRREKPPAAHCLLPRPRGTHLRFRRAPPWRERWRAPRAPGTSQPAEPRQQQQQQQLQQRGRLSGARGLHCSPRRRHRAALRAHPRVPWSHAPPALASATRTRARPARGPLHCPTSSVGASRTLCTPDDPKPGVSPGHCVGLSSALSTIVGMARPRAEHKGRGAPCKGQKAKTVSHHLLGMKSRSRVLAGTGQ